MNEHSLYRRVIAGEAGVGASPVRGLLRAAEAIYAGIVAVRNAHYDRRGPSHPLSIPIISVGNLTVGGTGKTPFVIELVGRLERMGFSPAVVARGYKATDGQPGDEERVIRTHCPSVVYVADPDRALACEIARSEFGADVIVLDDGFQHRRLERSLDIVLVDATCPFGYGHMLPRGRLREPVGSLKRAHVVVITRCDQVSQAALERIEQRLRLVANEATHLMGRHHVTSVERLDGTPLEGSLEGKRAVLFAGIANPDTFVTTVRLLGADVVGRCWWSDHHHYRRRDLDSLFRSGRFPPHDVVLTTEKDAVKLAALGFTEQAGLFVVKVAIDLRGEGDTMLQLVLDRTLRQG